MKRRPCNMPTDTLYIRNLIDRQKKLAIRRRKVNADIRRAMNAEKRKRFRKFAETMENLFLADPSCSDSKKIAALCSKFL